MRPTRMVSREIQETNEIIPVHWDSTGGLLVALIN